MLPTLALLLTLHFSPIVVVDLHNFKWTALDYQGEVIRTGPASGGRRYCPDIERKCKTPAGLFFPLTKRGRYYRSPLYPLGCGKPGEKPCAPMPFYVKLIHSGEGFHGSPGDNWSAPIHRSHGCCHLTTEDAEWINKFVSKTTPIYILPY